MITPSGLISVIQETSNLPHAMNTRKVQEYHISLCYAAII